MSRVSQAGLAVLLMLAQGLVVPAEALKDGSKDRGGGGSPGDNFKFHCQMIQRMVSQATDALYRPVRGAPRVGFLETPFRGRSARASHVDAEAPLDFRSTGPSAPQFRKWLANQLPSALHQIRKGRAEYPQSVIRLSVDSAPSDPRTGAARTDPLATRAGGIQQYVHTVGPKQVRVAQEGYCYLFEGGHEPFLFTREPREPALLSLAKGVRVWVKGLAPIASPAGPLEFLGFDLLHDPWNRATLERITVAPFVTHLAPMFASGY